MKYALISAGVAAVTALLFIAPMALAFAISFPEKFSIGIAASSCLSLVAIFVLAGRAYCKSMDARAKQVGVG